MIALEPPFHERSIVVRGDRDLMIDDLGTGRYELKIGAADFDLEIRTRRYPFRLSPGRVTVVRR